MLEFLWLPSAFEVLPFCSFCRKFYNSTISLFSSSWWYIKFFSCALWTLIFLPQLLFLLQSGSDLKLVTWRKAEGVDDNWEKKRNSFREFPFRFNCWNACIFQVSSYRLKVSTSKFLLLQDDDYLLLWFLVFFIPEYLIVLYSLSFVIINLL